MCLFQVKAVFDYFRDTEWYIEWLGKQLGVDRRPEHVGADWTWPGKSVCVNVCMNVCMTAGVNTRMVSTRLCAAVSCGSIFVVLWSRCRSWLSNMGLMHQLTAFDCLVNEESEISRDILHIIILPIKNRGLND